MNLSKLYQKWLSFWEEERNQIILACLPLYFSWYPVLYFYYENPKIRLYCLRSLINSLIFFCILIFSLIVSRLPVVGLVLGNFFHILGILIYLSFSFFFIYNLIKDKKIEIRYLEKLAFSLDSFLMRP